MRRVAALLLFLAVALFGGGALASHLNGAGGRPLPWPSSPEIDPPDRFLALRATGSEGRESYRPFGKAVRIFGSAPANDNSTGYTGHLKDDATGLVYMQARYYDPLVPRFLSTDPIGYQDQLNLYAYVANDPVNKTDPTGTGEGLCRGKREPRRKIVYVGRWRRRWEQQGQRPFAKAKEEHREQVPSIHSCERGRRKGDTGYWLDG